MEIYKGNFLSVYYHPENAFIEQQWDDTQEISEVEYKQDLLSYVPLIEKHKSKKLLVDLTRFTMPLSYEMQNWILENVHIPAQEAGLRYEAVIIPPDMYEMMSEEDLIRSNPPGEYQKHYFDNKGKGLTWLINQ